MTPEEYRALALRTEKPHGLAIDTQASRLLHGAIGIATEAGELLDQVKRTLFYQLPMDAVNVLEECGDLLWYINLALDSCGYTMAQAMERNIDKLKKRYPEGFTSDKALNRDLGAERTVLEGHHCTESGGCKSAECDR